ncbi:17142_t:CDS:1, partial [Racocetra persica]
LLVKTVVRVSIATTSYSEKTTEITEEPTSRDNISQQGDGIRNYLIISAIIIILIIFK